MWQGGKRESWVATELSYKHLPSLISDKWPEALCMSLQKVAYLMTSRYWQIICWKGFQRQQGADKRASQSVNKLKIHA